MTGAWSSKGWACQTSEEKGHFFTPSFGEGRGEEWRRAIEKREEGKEDPSP